MKKSKKLFEKYITKEVLLIVIIILIASITFGAYKYNELWRKNSFNKVNSILLANELNRTQGNLGKSIQKSDNLQGELNFQEERVTNLSDQFEEVAETVGILDKLSKTDSELLQKYSKVFFLNEHYVPRQLINIDKENLYSESETHKLQAEVLNYLEKMLADAEKNDINIYVKSAYRSFQTQGYIKSTYTIYYGSGANAFSADQGYSEHQLGTTVDLIALGLGGQLDGFQNTPAYDWLLENAHRYGFTLSYPNGNNYYIFEPWHWRFVGTELARDLYRDGNNFYDVAQRDIDKYLISIFD